MVMGTTDINRFLIVDNEILFTVAQTPWEQSLKAVLKNK
ncbi:hypothetical protein CP04DC42_0566 [Chlamydia psittaci 04DC42]|uniref:Uncharacterized protein n=1 Tax=Chlamydia psittaci 99DC5 TaxID=1112251 RepID=A0ABP2X3X6_CHLPS|nr:hypothetical protein B595_0164 [Chlamydia psittaci 84/55]AFS21270.1 hypothetical protein B599_0161 [Chlamydia psittaci MN]AFS22339.1 hypothetical protein B600_0169 [Chlamydia psittaci VS225]AFS23508.1 hypothetical protein B601_0159 [Chlamydia psittaci WS/RT/E30]AFS24418.1 hypothetical protein B602_0158 [Chlamydia psittaci M56]AFS26077.1 hypothetical protein B603_0161 [Chlamydia psittaci WC]AFS26577.1 hypothetical protein B711_0167 [Chlamydia psittaci CP3]AFS27687.1 hypothetical protein B7